MLNRNAFVGMVAVMCCAQVALGAASVRSVGTQNVGVTTARAGSLRATPTKTVSSPSRTSVETPAIGSNVGRLATSSGGTIGNKPGKIGKAGSAASAAALSDLERSIAELSNNYDALSNQYAQLALGISDATATALNAKSASDANTEQIALKMNSTDFNTKFDSRAETAGLADKSFVQSYVSENAPTPDLTGYYTSTEVEDRLASKLGIGSDFNSAFDLRLEDKGIESNVSNLNTRVTAIEENPGVNSDAVNSLINTKVEDLRGEVTAGLTTTLENAKAYADSHKGMNESEQTAFNTLTENVSTLTTQMDSKLSKDEASSTYSTKDELANAVIGGQVDLSGYATTGTVNALAERVSGAETAIQNNTSALNSKVDTGTLNTLAEQVNANSTALAGKADKTELNFLCDDPSFNVATVTDGDTPKSRVTVSCNGVTKGSFDIATGDGGGNAVCGVLLDKTTLKQDSSNPDKITGYKLQFKDTCTNEQVGEVVINNGADGAAGENACSTIVTATKVGTKTTLVGKNSCTQETVWTEEVNDGATGAPGAGIEYQGIVQNCLELHTHDGAQKGYAWFNKGDNLLYISDGSGFTDCPDGGVPFKGDQGEQGEQGDPGCGINADVSNKIVDSKIVGKTVTLKNACTNAVIDTFDIMHGEDGEDGSSGETPTFTIKTDGAERQLVVTTVKDGEKNLGDIRGPKGEKGDGICPEGQIIKLEQRGNAVDLLCDEAD